VLITITDAVHSLPETSRESETLPTLDQVTAERQSRRQQAISTEQTTHSTTADASTDATAPGSPEELEEEADQQGAFNEETGEINWDCPCLGGMAHGPCGEEFRTAFSCFVYSKEEPKGVDCIENFKGMQECFRKHPEIYGSELDEDEVDAAATGEPMPAGSGQPEPALTASVAGVEPSASQQSVSASRPQSQSSAGQSEQASDNTSSTKRAQAARDQVVAQHEPTSESEDMVPKAWHDASVQDSKGQK